MFISNVKNLEKVIDGISKIASGKEASESDLKSIRDLAFQAREILAEMGKEEQKLVHTIEVNNKCIYCNKAFTQAVYIKNGIKNGISYNAKCTNCGKNYISRIMLE